MRKSSLKSKNGWRRKLTLVGALLVAVLFFTNDFGLVDTEKSAIVTAVGVDYAEGGYTATCQVMPPGSKDAPVSPVLAEGKGATVGESFSNIPASSGWFPKLGFCRLIILGSGVEEAGVPEALRYFLENEGFNDSALVAACKGSAADFLKAAGEDRFVQILNKSSRKVNEVISVNLKDFAESHFSMSRAAVLPLVDATAEPPEEGQEPQPEFDAKEALLLNKGFSSGTLDARGTRAFNLLTQPRTKGYYASLDGKTAFEIDRKRVKAEYAVAGGRVNAKVSVTVRLSVVGGAGQSGRRTASGNELTAADAAAAEAAIREDIAALYAAAEANNCDFLGIGERLYRYATADWRALQKERPDGYLQGLTLDLSVTVKPA